MKSVLLFVATMSLVLTAWAGETAGRPRLAAAPDGSIVGGLQVRPDAEGEFSLFRFDPDSGRVSGLGRFTGVLAGVAASPDGGVLSLTRDGSLGCHGDDFRRLALPDARWQMLDLAVFQGSAVAVHQAHGRLRLVRPGADESWDTIDDGMADPGPVAMARLVPLADALHLFWLGRNEDFSAGVIRHAVWHQNRWMESAPLATGDVRTLAVFPVERAIALVAVIPDPLAARPAELRAWSWDGGWRERNFAPTGLRDNLVAAAGFAGAVHDGEAVWLATIHGGATLDHAAGTLVLVPAADDEAGSGLPGLAVFAACLGLLAVYCRRSRVLSRMLPGRPPDLISRGVALLVDWLLVSVGITAYHFAAGDTLILDRLMTVEYLHRLFWINLAAFALFAALGETLFGCTPGKYLAGLRVRSVRGGPPGVGQALCRNLLRAVDMFPLAIAVPGLIGLMAAICNPRRQRVGDMVAGTMVRRHTPYLGRAYILASASPRRRELLTGLGITFRVMPPEIDETAIAGTTPADTARRLAEAKATEVMGQVGPSGEIIVAADTVVVLDGEILGKPADAEEAVRMLKRLSGRTHTVITGITVWDAATGQGLSEVETTAVEFRRLADREIEAYVATGDPLDKAGAYGVQTGNLVREVRGSLSNVAGLPMEKLLWLIQRLDA